MNTGSSKSLDSRAWRGLYRAALFDIDEINSRSALPKQRKRSERETPSLSLRLRVARSYPHQANAARTGSNTFEPVRIVCEHHSSGID
jgi:hypothetical protein